MTLPPPPQVGAIVDEFTKWLSLQCTEVMMAEVNGDYYAQMQAATHNNWEQTAEEAALQTISQKEYFVRITE
jgi:hypothetical protein